MSPLVPLALGLTAAAAGTAYALSDKTPAGKGVFIRSVRHCGTPDQCVAAARKMGLKWVAILLAWQFTDKRSTVYLNTDLVAAAKAFRRAGIKVWLWAWPVPGKAAELVSLYDSARAGGVKPRGFILDPEGPYYGKRHELAAHQDLELVESLRVPIGVTTYGGGPPMHPSFAWNVWARTDFGIPQIYDSKHRLGADYPRKSLESWRAAGWKTVIPAWGASNKHSAPDMVWHIEQTPPMYRAACWWDLYWLMLSAKRRQVVADMRIPRVRRMAKVA